MPIHAWSIEDVRAAEAAAMAQLPDGELMARAAHGLALVALARLEDTGHARVVVLAGSGGNGGDALYAAAELAARGEAAARAAAAQETGDASPSGAETEIVGVEIAEAEIAGVEIAGVVGVLLGEHTHEPARAAAEAAGVLLLDARSDDGRAQAHAALAEADLVIDGIAGIGGRPGLAAGYPLAWDLVEAIPEDAYVLAVDLPSGIDPAGERVVADAVYADETVSFGVCKPVHVLAGAPACGLLTVVDIGLEEVGEPAAERLVRDDVAALWPVPGPQDDKYSRGVLGIVAGGEHYTGAALLSVTAAVCAGAGMVRYVGPSGPTGLVRAQVPEAVFGPGHVQAWLVGSGLDPAPADGDELGHAQVGAARAALDSPHPCVVDAGGLDLLDGPRRHSGARTLLTPHAGELARLLTRLARAGVLERRDAGDGADAGGAAGAGDAAAEAEVTVDAVRAAPVEHARRAAEALHATVLLKGSTTYVVPPTAALPTYGQSDGPAWLATAGSGDVLAGLAGALLAAGLDPLIAGALAAQVHGLAGHEANPDGPVRAHDVAQAIPRVVAAALRRGARLGIVGE